MATKISRFNPQRMSEEDVLNLSTGRDQLLKLMMRHMKDCLDDDGNQHFILYGPRGIGKTFFTRLLSIHHNKSKDFVRSKFIQFPEEQSNIQFVADVLDMISTKLEGKTYSSMVNRWEVTDMEWRKAKERLKKNLVSIKKDAKIKHVFFTMENLQDFIPQLDEIENGRMREFLSDFEEITLIGSSLHPELDNDYSKRLFQVFNKIDIQPWNEMDYINYYKKKAIQKNKDDKDQSQTLKNKIRAIAKFTGGSPRLAVILNDLVINNDILSTCEIMNGIIDELTPYYQDLSKDIPPRSRTLFDMLIRMGENITQSELAANLNPPQEQKTIARSFKWLTDNYYVTSLKQMKANVKHYYVRDRLYVLYYQNREVMADQPFSFIEMFVDFLTEYYDQSELRNRFLALDKSHEQSKHLYLAYFKHMNIHFNKEANAEKLSNMLENLEHFKSKFRKWEELYKDNKDDVVIQEIEAIPAIEKTDLHYILIATSYAQLNNLDKAILNIQEGLKLNKRNPVYYRFLGECFTFQKKYKEAILPLLKSHELNPDNSRTIFLLGDCYYYLKDYKNAVVSYEEVIELEPDNIAALNKAGAIHQNEEKYKLAESYFLKSHKLRPNSDKQNFYLGSLYFLMKDFKKSTKYLNNAFEINKNFYHVHFLLGLIQFKSQKFKEAEKHFVLNYKADKTNNLVGYYLLASLLLQAKFEEIINFLELDNNKKPEIYIAESLLFVGNQDRPTFFHLVKECLSGIISLKNDWLIPFVLKLTIELYGSEQLELLQDLIEELESIKLENPSITVLIQTWKYILNPDQYDLASLHPDARVTIEAILKNSKSELPR